MNSSKINIYTIFTLAVLMLAGVIACQKEKPESTATAKSPEVSALKPADLEISELMAALNLYYFKEPRQAPDFELLSVNGRKVSLSQYRGNVVLLSFWTTW